MAVEGLNLSQFFKVTIAIYEYKFFAYVFFVNFEVYIKRDNFMVAGAEFWAGITVLTRPSFVDNIRCSILSPLVGLFTC